MSSRPDAATLRAWAMRWGRIRRDAYAELVASYTPEQRAIIARLTEAKRQERLAQERARWPEGASGAHPSLCGWPDEPPQPE